MVETIFIHKVLKELEKFFIKKNNFQLTGANFDLVLFAPTDKHSLDAKFSLLLSAKNFNSSNQRDLIKEFITYFRETLGIDEYISISRVNILHTEDPFVKNINFMFPYREEVREIMDDIPIGGVKITGFLVKSLVLDKLISNSIVEMELINGEMVRAKIIEINNNFEVKVEKTSDKNIEKINLEKIVKVF